MSPSSDKSKLYDVQITFHSAHDLPVSDVPSLSADPYLLASLRVPSYDKGEPGPPPLLFSTRTIHRTRDPDWGGEVWRVGGVPGSGFALRIGVRDEDVGKKDDRLGEARVSFFGIAASKKFKRDDRDAGLNWGQVREGLDVARREAPIKKRRGGARAFLLTYLASVLARGVSPKSAKVVVSVRVLGLSENQEDRRVYTLGPNYYSLHFSPLLGRVMGTKSANPSNAAQPTVSNFQGNQLQLTGPVPKDLEHRYVGYRPFIESLFSKYDSVLSWKLILTPSICRSGIKGRILNHALREQYRCVYSRDQATVYGCVERHQHASNVDSNDNGSQPHPSQSPDVNPLTAQFLRMVQHGAGHRLYTYVITLDAQWRFTETGDEFAIEILSKHSMHADAAPHIAYSGEMFVRRIGTQGWEAEELDEADPQNDEEKYPPSAYELVIDNDSGTYRPRKELLPLLAEFLGGEANLGMLLFVRGGPGGLGKITAIDGFDEGLKNTKKRRAEAKKSQSEGGETRRVQVRRGSSVSSVGSMSSGEVKGVVREGAHGREGDRSRLEGEGAGVKGNGGVGENGKARGGEAKQGVGRVLDVVRGKVAEEKGKVEGVKAGITRIAE
ncbi:hypothetical protein FRC10_011072 [Ceratobasidium sp. 414]|nr:hypothetical protein FRC10_011072 [Ceratobasidium sp. 414]